MKTELSLSLMQISVVLISTALSVWSGYLLKELISERNDMLRTPEWQKKLPPTAIAQRLRKIFAFCYLTTFAIYFLGAFLLGWF